MVKNAYLRETKGEFENDLWEIMNEVKDEVEENGIWKYGTRFDISCDNGTLNRREEFDDFGFNYLHHRADEIRQIIKDIHQCLEKQDSTHMDLFFKPEGVIILLSTNKKIDNALFYKCSEDVGKDKKGYRQVTHHFRSNDLSNPLKIALDFDYILHKKTNYVWDMSMDDGLRDILKDCVKESKNVNYSYSDVRTHEEIQEDNRKQRQEQQKQQMQQQQQEQQEYDKQLQQMLDQFEETKRQMMLLMGIYMAQQQQQEEEFEDEEEFEEFEEDEE